MTVLLSLLNGHKLNYIYALTVWMRIKKDTALINNVEQILRQRCSTNVVAIMERLRNPNVFGGHDNVWENGIED